MTQPEINQEPHSHPIECFASLKNVKSRKLDEMMSSCKVLWVLLLLAGFFDELLWRISNFFILICDFLLLFLLLF